MKITKALIPYIEQAMGFELYPAQKEYLLGPEPFTDEQIKFVESILESPLSIYQRAYLKKGPVYKSSGRATGATTAHCIRLALSEGETIDIRKIHKYSDRHDRTYAHGFFIHEFLNIHKKLMMYGLRVRTITDGRL